MIICVYPNFNSCLLAKMASLACFWKSTFWYLVSHRKAISPTHGFCMMASPNGNIFALQAICAGISPVTGEFPAQRPVTRTFDVFFNLRLNKRMSEQWWGWWFETPSRSLWHHCNGLNMYDSVYLIMPPISTCLQRWAVATFGNIVTWGRCGASDYKLKFHEIWIMKFGFEKWVTGRHTSI